MAEKESKTNNKELGLGVIFLLLVLGVFIIWVLTGGPNGKNNKDTKDKTLFYPNDTTKTETFGVTKDSTIPTTTVGSYGLTTHKK